MTVVFLLFLMQVINALDYYILLDSFYNIKISIMLDVQLWTCGWLTYLFITLNTLVP
jgi:hypothetical protein